MLALVDTHLQEVLAKNFITHVDGIDLSGFVQPASIDLPVGSTLYHVEHKFLPFNQPIKDSLQTLASQTIDATQGAVLYKGQTYLIPCLDVTLPENLFGKISPKSSLGRIDVLIRAIVDNTGIYDTIFPATQGTLRLEVTPQSFNIKVKKGLPLTQLMLFEDDHATHTYDTSEAFLFEDQTVVRPQCYQNNMMVSLGVGNFETIGYKARYTDQIIDIDKLSTYEPSAFFEPIQVHGSGKEKKVILEKDRFYILPTKEKIRVPAQYSIELVPFTHLMGELRVHYAGFFDPGFGGATGATGVLEVRPHEDSIVFDGQPICLMEVYTNKAIPASLYGEAGNTYQGQAGPRLAKYFKQS